MTSPPPTLPQVPIRTAKDHPRFADGTDSGPTEVPATKRIDTEAARARVESRRAEKASDKPPTTRRRSETTPAPVIPYSKGMFKAPITSLYDQAGQLLCYVVYPIGQATRQQAESCGSAWDEVAQSNPTVRRWLGGMTKTGAWGKLIAAHAPILLATVFVFGPESFRERMAGTMADSMEQMTEGNPGVQDPN